MAVADYFAADYMGARDKFRAVAKAAGAALLTYHCPAAPPPGLGGEGLTTDAARLGPAEARRLLVALSGTHGVEGFCGSGIEVGWLAGGIVRALPPDTALLLVHAINPYGFAWLRRVNEDNVDLNRNFVDHAEPYPVNAGYEALKHAICPAQWDEATLARTAAELDAYGRHHGAMALQSAISSGQYGHPQGVFYGGTSPVWSNRTLAEILRQHGAGTKRLAFIDLHTGLGPHGYGEIMNGHAAGAPGHRRVEAWYAGEAMSTDAGSSSSAVVTGDTLVGIERALPASEVTGITLEYGTIPLDDVLLAVRADNWLHAHGDPSSARGRAIKTQIRRAFYPDTDDWKRLVFERSLDVYRRALGALAAS